VSRALDIRISAAADIGFIVHEAGEAVAAFTTRAELANWIEDRLGQLPGEVEREQRDRSDAMATFPQVIAQRKPGLFSRG